MPCRQWEAAGWLSLGSDVMETPAWHPREVGGGGRQCWLCRKEDGLTTAVPVGVIMCKSLGVRGAWGGEEGGSSQATQWSPGSRAH